MPVTTGRDAGVSQFARFCQPSATVVCFDHSWSSELGYGVIRGFRVLDHDISQLTVQQNNPHATRRP